VVPASASVSKPAPGDRRRRAARPDQVIKDIPLAGGGTRRERYDLLGRLLWQEEPDGSWLRFRYDLDGQLASIEHSSGERVEYESDSEGREWRARTARTETIIRLSANGLPCETVLRLDGHEWLVQYKRDAQNRVIAIRYPQSPAWTRLDWSGTTDTKRLTFSCGPEEYCRLASDSAAGVSTVSYANGTRTREEFDAVSMSLRRLAVFDRAGELAHELLYEYEDDGERLRQAGPQTFTYDPAGRLASCTAGGVTRSYEYDERGRLRRSRVGDAACEFSYGASPAVTSVAEADGAPVAFEYDALGRRTARRDERGETLYEYNIFGHLAHVRLPDGKSVRYVYDGCGRLVARETDGGREYYVPGLDGQRLVAADDAGCVRHSYLWLAHQCLGRVAGPQGEPLAESYHRAHGGHLTGVGDATGCVRASAHADPYGTDALLDGLTPAFAGLFGDAATGLVYASARWLDPAVAQFLTPDSWYGIDPARQLPARLRRVLRVTPGGTAHIRSPQDAYDWCRHDPVNFTDWNGHDGGRIVWSIISMLIWEQQLTVASLQLWVLDIILDILQVIIFRPAWDTDGYWHSSAFNLSAPVGSTRLGSFALVLNGLLMGERAFTLGNVIWARHDELTKAEELGKRSLLLCSNVATYDTAIAGDFKKNFVKVESGSQLQARQITFIRGQAIHFARQFPSSFPVSSLSVSEYKPAAATPVSNLSLPIDQIILKVAQAADLTGYANGNFIRINGTSNATPPVPTPVFFARLAAAVRAPSDIVLDTPLPTATYSGLSVVKMDSNGAAAAGQSVPPDTTGTAIPTRVGVGARTDLARLHGLAITNAGGSIQRRIVTMLMLDCTVAALPAGLTGIVTVEHLNALNTPATQATGKMTSARVIQRDAGQTTNFTVGQSVQIDVTGGGGGANRAFGVVESFDPATGNITLIEAIPAPPFNNGVAVTVLQMERTGNTLAADNIQGSATHLFVFVNQPTDLAQNDIIRVRPSGQLNSGAVRLLATAPTVVAVLDSALPNTHSNNLSVQVFMPDNTTARTGVTAPQLRTRLVVPTGTANPYAAGQEFYITDGTEETYGKVTSTSGQDVILEKPIELQMLPAVTVTLITPTGKSTPDGKLDESVVLVPAEPSIELTRREAVENHELRHVWQEAVCGPFFFSFPIPWLLNLGFSFSHSAHSASQILRHISLGGLDTIFAGLIWGTPGVFKWIGSGFKDSSHFESASVLMGVMADNEGKVIRFATATAEQMKNLSSGTYISLKLRDELFNIVDAVNEGEKKITLRFALDTQQVSIGDTVPVTYSPFEQIRKNISKYFSLNLGQLLADHIPQAWGRVLINFFNRESWFPWFGVYPWALMLAGGNQDRISAEQDAAFHSGDLYTNIPMARPNKVYQGHFTKLFAFVQIRTTSISVGYDMNTMLQVKRQSGSSAAATQVAGSTLSGDTFKFDKRYWIPMSDRAENAHGIFFNSSAAEVFDLLLFDQLTDSVTFQTGFDVDFAEWNKLTVLELPVTLTPASPVFETEVVTFAVSVDSAVTYTLNVPVGSAGTFSGLTYTAPVLPGGTASQNQTVEIYAEYSLNHPIFVGDGQLAPTLLTAAELKNLCRTVTVEVQQLTLPTGLTVKTGESKEFDVPIEPSVIGNPSPLTPPGALGNARVEIVSRGRPTRLRFVAPAGVTAATNVSVPLTFGTGTVTRTINFNIQITL
jgi:YD repeat-containing protein